MIKINKYRYIPSSIIEALLRTIMTTEEAERLTNQLKKQQDFEEKEGEGK